MIRPPSPEHRRSVTILGVTGSIGRSTVAVLRTRPELYRIEAVTAWSSVAALAEVARLLGARLAVIGREDLLSELRTRLEGSGIEETGIVDRVEGADAPALKPGDVIVRVDPRYFRPAEVETLLGDPTKAHEKLGWKPEITARAMCSEMVAADLESARRQAVLQMHGYATPISREN